MHKLHVVPGYYRHFKGNIYYVYGLFTVKGSTERWISYVPIGGPAKGMRSLLSPEEFFEHIENHSDRPEYVGPRNVLVVERYWGPSPADEALLKNLLRATLLNR